MAGKQYQQSRLPLPFTSILDFDPTIPGPHRSLPTEVPNRTSIPFYLSCSTPQRRAVLFVKRGLFYHTDAKEQTVRQGGMAAWTGKGMNNWERGNPLPYC
jgi:hypothetical protein